MSKTASNIAGAINDAHRKVEAAKVEGAKYAIECGNLLSEAKATTAHGKWDAWVKANCAFSLRTAQLYMKVAKFVGGDPAKAQRVADLSLREVAAEISKPRLSDKDNSDANDLLAKWYGADASVKIRFATSLLEAKEIDLPIFRNICASVGMTSEAAAKNIAGWLASHVPAARHAELLDNFKKAGAIEIARAMSELGPAPLYVSDEGPSGSRRGLHHHSSKTQV